MPFDPQIKDWRSDRALMLVHGVGDYKPGDYETLKQALRAALGDAEWNKIALYEMFWDPISDWVAAKLQAGQVVTDLIQLFKPSFGTTALGAAAAESAGDVVWPVLVLDARRALRDACLAQVQQMLKDGWRSRRIAMPDQKLSVICHSLGCFHTYETLCTLATDVALGLTTSFDGVTFDSVVMVASPVQLIRHVAGKIHTVVPEPNGLACMRGDALGPPGRAEADGSFVPYVRRFLSITGDLDPVGGYLFRSPVVDAYMNIPDTDTFVEHQQLASVNSRADLLQLLTDAVASHTRPVVRPSNPHDWVTYVEHNGGRIRDCVLG